MKNKIIILAVLCVLLSCTDAKYKKGDAICAYGISMTIKRVHTFEGTGAGGTNYTCRYSDDNGVLREVRVYETEISKCN